MIKNKEIKIKLKKFQYRGLFNENMFIANQISENIINLDIDNDTSINDSIIMISPYNASLMGVKKSKLGIVKYSDNIYINNQLKHDNSYYIFDKNGFVNYKLNLLENSEFEFGINYDFNKIKKVKGIYE